MTCREKLAIEHPEDLNPTLPCGCNGCPSNYGYLPNPEGGCHTITCTECWDREIPETEKPKSDIPWGQIKDLIDTGMTKRDREIHLYFNPETGWSMNIYPWPDAEDLYEQYQKGRITANDFREKMGLPRIEFEEDPRFYGLKCQIQTTDYKEE